MTVNVNDKWKIVIIFVACAVVMFFMNELQKHISVGDSTLNLIGLLSYVIPTFVVLKIQDWRPEAVSVGRLLSSLFFVFGAVGLALIFSRYWMEWAREIDSGGEILGKVRPVESPSKSSPMDNLFHMLIAPIAEEVTFRLGMLGILIRVMSRSAALLLSSALFALGHVYGYTWVQLVPVFVFGLLAGVTYLTTGLGFAILFHSILNCWPYVTENFYKSEAFLGTLAVLLFFGLIVFLVRLVRQRKSVFG